jgi:hypothetical protein
MKAAKPGDWKVEPLPTNRVTVRLDRWFSAEEMTSIRRGLVPAAMEDKWFIYWKDDALFLHRSWTGFSIYVIRFVAEGGGWRMIEADVNRDPAQYSLSDDERDVDMISYLLDVLLLRRAVDPLGARSDESLLATWSQVGRAMLGQHPDAKETEPADPSEDEK